MEVHLSVFVFKCLIFIFIFLQPGKVLKSVTINSRRTGSIGKWFNNEFANSTVKKKDKERVERARLHSAVSIAGVASALAAVTAAENTSGSPSKTSMALALATELLASHCIEIAESAGADCDRLVSAVRSALDIQSSSDLMTLTAAAATGTYLLNTYILQKPNCYTTPLSSCFDHY